VRVSAGHRAAIIVREPARTEPGEPYGIVAIAASAGGIIALGHVLGGLPTGFPVPVVVVQHPGGGTVIVEYPALAEFKGMPEAVVTAGAVDFILPLDEIATVIRGLVEANRS
jgi:two-component system chemotaxis response regulator CheB